MKDKKNLMNIYKKQKIENKDKISYLILRNYKSFKKN